MDSNKKYRLIISACQVASFIVLLAIILFFATTRINEIRIDTDLKSMSPNIIEDDSIQDAIDTLSNDIEKRFSLILTSSDPADVEDASEDFLNLVEGNTDLFAEIDSLNNLDELKTLLIEYRFQLAPSSEEKKLTDFSDKQIIDEAERKLYGLDSSVRLFSIIQDPMGFLNDFLFSAGSQKNTSDFPAEIFEDGETTYYFPLFFSIKGSALNLKTQELIEKKLLSFEREIASEYSSISFLHSGVFFFARDAAKKSQRDISFISISSSLGILFLLLGVFRSLIPLLLPTLSVVIGIGFAFVVCHIIFGSVHIITIVFGAGLIGVVIDYALHFYYHYDKGCDPKHRFALIKALIFSLFTSAVGYAALAFSDIHSLKRVALFSTIGLLAAWLTVVSAGHLFVSKKTQSHDQFIIRILQYSLSIMNAFKPKHTVFFIICILATFTAFTLKGINVSDDPRLFFKPDKEILKEERTAGNITSAFEPGNYLVVRGKTTQDIYKTIEELNVDSTFKKQELLGIHSWIPSPERQKENYTANARFYDKNGIVYTFLESIGIKSETIESIKDDYLRSGNKVLDPNIFMNTVGNSAPPLWIEASNEIFSFILISRDADSKGLLRAAKANSNIYYINTAKMAAESIKEQRESAFALMFIAILFIAALVFIRYKTLKSVWLVSVPCIAILVTISIFQALSIPLTLFHIMAMFLVLGLGMDYVIFVTELRDNSIQTLVAVVLSAMTSLISFGLLSLSSLPVVQAFGLTVLVGNSFNFIGALILSSQLRHIGPLDNLQTNE